MQNLTDRRRKAKEFFWRDKSGRGEKNTYTMSEVITSFKGETNDDGRAASTWAKAAEVGDRWESTDAELTRIK